MFGRPLVYFGYHLVDASAHCVGFRAVAAYSGGGSWYAVQSGPPCPLGTTNLIDSRCAERFIRRLVEASEVYSLDDALHFYLNALAAPTTIAAGYFGPAIEALRSAYLKRNPGAYQTSLLGAEQARELRRQWAALIGAMDLNNEAKKQLIGRASQLNQVAARDLNARFLTCLNLATNALEETAWNRRNATAHGTLVPEDGFVDLIKDLKVMKNLFHRILLKLTGASDTYIDYFSLGLPARPIESATAGN
jgi:hypothetical protein